MAVELAAIEDVYRRRYGQFRRVAFALVGDRERAHDAVQEAFARAIRSRAEIESLEAWLWRTVANACADARRDAARTLPPHAPAAGVDAADWAELHAAIAALPERQRLVLFLRHYADLDYETIAAATGVERGTVAATLHAAHARLRDAIEEVA